MPAYKIASAISTNTPLLRYVGEIGKPVDLLDRRRHDRRRAARARDAARGQRPGRRPAVHRRAIPLSGTSSTCASSRRSATEFPDAVIGFSSHDNGICDARRRVRARRVRIVEKHFTLNRAMKGTDHAFSLEPQGLRKMVRDLRRARLALG